MIQTLRETAYDRTVRVAEEALAWSKEEENPRHKLYYLNMASRSVINADKILNGKED